MLMREIVEVANLKLQGHEFLRQHFLSFILPLLTEPQRSYWNYNLGLAVKNGMPQNDEECVYLKIGAFLGHMYQKEILTIEQIKSFPIDFQRYILQGLVGLVELKASLIESS